jgi:hypothetical protein
VGIAWVDAFFRFRGVGAAGGCWESAGWLGGWITG